ncbi:MAG TPA: hypothetical protein VF575_04010 [Candidatus Saccharimonadales bacterium]|jgi:cytoskeletal protein RodZ
MEANRSTAGKSRYLIILTILLLLVAGVIVARGALSSVDNRTQPTQQSPRTTNQNSTESTNGSTQETNTPSDRTVPSQSGGEANTILNPSQ